MPSVTGHVLGNPDAFQDIILSRVGQLLLFDGTKAVGFVATSFSDVDVSEAIKSRRSCTYPANYVYRQPETHVLDDFHAGTSTGQLMPLAIPATRRPGDEVVLISLALSVCYCREELYRLKPKEQLQPTVSHTVDDVMHRFGASYDVCMRMAKTATVDTLLTNSIVTSRAAHIIRTICKSGHDSLLFDFGADYTPVMEICWANELFLMKEAAARFAWHLSLSHIIAASCSHDTKFASNMLEYVKLCNSMIAISMNLLRGSRLSSAGDPIPGADIRRIPSGPISGRFEKDVHVRRNEWCEAEYRIVSYACGDDSPNFDEAAFLLPLQKPFAPLRCLWAAQQHLRSFTL